jgi:hypothetical protein
VLRPFFALDEDEEPRRVKKGIASRVDEREINMAAVIGKLGGEVRRDQ